MGNPTIYDVAALAGVSPGTVSRYMNGYELREYNRVKVAKAIEDLGFEENLIAKGLKSNRSMAIAVLLPELRGLFSFDILKNLEMVLEEKDYTMMISDYESDSVRLAQRLDHFRRRSIDGLILFPLANGDSCLNSLEEYRDAGIPVVSMSDRIRGFSCDYIHGGNRFVSFQAVDHLLSRGHRNIRIVTGRRETGVTEERMEGCREAFLKHGLSAGDMHIIWTDYTMEDALSKIGESLASDLPTALYCTSYYITMGAVLAVNGSKYQLGTDVSLIGHDYFAGTEIVSPALTTVEHDLESLGREAGLLMMDRIGNGIPDEYLEIEIPMKLNIRESVRALT